MKPTKEMTEHFLRKELADVAKTKKTKVIDDQRDFNQLEAGKVKVHHVNKTKPQN